MVELGTMSEPSTLEYAPQPVVGSVEVRRPASGAALITVHSCLSRVLGGLITPVVAALVSVWLFFMLPEATGTHGRT